MNWYHWIKFAAYDQWKSQVEQSAYKNPYPFKEWFGGDERVYIPFQPESQQDAFGQDDKYVLALLQDQGCTDIDYRNGYAMFQGRKFKIGKLLNRFRAEHITELQMKGESGEIYNVENELRRTHQYYDGLQEDFMNSPLRASKGSNQFMVVISQNPHDVAKMSTDRNWTSCMELGEGSHYEDIFCEVAEGGLVAYLIYNNDVQIQNPLARIRIRRFENRAGQSVGIQEESIYGNDISGFDDVVRSWLITKQGDVASGEYKLKGGSYTDTFGDGNDIMVAPNKPEDIAKWLQGTDPNAVYTVYEVNDDLAEAWNEFSEDNYLGEDEKIENNSKVFNEPEPAKEYLEMLQQYSYGEEEEYIRKYMGEAGDTDWTDVDEATDEYDVDRYTEYHRKIDNTYTMKREALKLVMTNPEGTFPTEIIKMSHDLLFSGAFNNSTYSELKQKFVRMFPKYCSREDVMSVSRQGLLRNLGDLPDEHREMLKEEYLQQAMSILDNPDILATASFAGEYSRVSDVVIPSYIHDSVLAPLETFYKPIPEPIVRKLVNLVSVEFIGGREITEAIKLTIAREIAHTLSTTDSDTPTVQRFYQSLLPYWGPNHRYYEFLDNPVPPASINVSTLGYNIARLGKNGRQFIPFMQQKLQEERQALEEAKQKEAGEPGSGPKHPISLQWSSLIKVIGMNIENYLYIIDYLENGEPSGKYSFDNR